MHHSHVVASFLYVNANGISTIDNTSWIFIHFYVVQGWKQISLLVCVEKVGMQGIAKKHSSFDVNCHGQFWWIKCQRLVWKIHIHGLFISGVLTFKFENALKVDSFM